MRIVMVLLLTCIGNASAADASAADNDARAIVARAVAAYERSDTLARNYTYKARSEVHELDSKGKVKAVHSTTAEVLPIGGKSYFHELAKDDRPLPKGEAAKETARLDRATAAASQMTEADRRKAVEDAQRERAKRRAELKDVPDAFDFKMLRPEEINGRAVWRIEATPRPGYKGAYKGILHNVEGRLWIDQQDDHWVKADLDVLHAFSLGLFLARVGEGTRLTYEMMRVNDELWVPKQLTLKASARLVLLKKLNIKQTVTFSEYRRFQTDSRLISSE
jgi:hypothetical protein